jgi:hypothetical protein
VRSGRGWRVAVAGVVLLAAGGCASPSVWERSFDGPTAALKKAPESAAAARIREVPWTRMQETLGDLREQVAKSDIHPDEWTPEQRAEAKARLLRGLQISADPARVEVLGRSEFRTTEAVKPSDASLQDFARRLGATTVVYATTSLGKADTIVDKPVTTTYNDSWGGAGGGRERGGRYRDPIFSGTSTSWVPVVVQTEERGFVAFYLKD